MVKIVDNEKEFHPKLFVLHESFMPINDRMSRSSFFDEFNQKTRKYLVAVEDNTREPIGYIGLMDCDSDLNIIGIVVHEHFQGRGVGKMLINKAVDYALSLQKKSLSLEVDIQNSKAINFYLSNSFKQVSVRKNYYHSSDAIVMFRFL